MFFNRASCKNCRTLFLVTITLLSLQVFAQTWSGDVNWDKSPGRTGWPLNGADTTISLANYTGVALPIISVNSVSTPSGMMEQNGATLTLQVNLTATGRIAFFNNGTVVIAFRYHT